jgi:hypothetical protein
MVVCLDTETILPFFRHSSCSSMSEEHLMGLSMSVMFYVTMGLKAPLLEPTVARYWDPGVLTVVQQ